MGKYRKEGWHADDADFSPDDHGLEAVVFSALIRGLGVEIRVIRLLGLPTEALPAAGLGQVVQHLGVAGHFPRQNAEQEHGRHHDDRVLN